MEAAIDGKTVPWRDNAMVSQVSQAMKLKYRDAILERANSACEHSAESNTIEHAQD